jgi:hypothetical protein
LDNQSSVVTQRDVVPTQVFSCVDVSKNSGAPCEAERKIASVPHDSGFIDAADNTLNASFVDNVPGLKILLSQRHYVGKPLPSNWRNGWAIVDYCLRDRDGRLNSDIMVRRIEDAGLRRPSAAIVEELCLSHSSGARIQAASQVTHPSHVLRLRSLRTLRSFSSRR